MQRTCALNALKCLGTLLDEAKDLIEFRGEEVEGSEDATIRTKIISMNQSAVVSECTRQMR